jgi:hypothetical protein
MTGPKVKRKKAKPGPKKLHPAFVTRTVQNKKATLQTRMAFHFHIVDD